MSRNAIIASLVAALLVNSANGSPATPAKTHSSAATPTSSSHNKSKAKRKPAKAPRALVHQKAVRAATHAPAPQRSAGERPHAPVAPSRVRSAKLPKVEPRQPPAKPAQLRKVKLALPPPMRGSYTSLERQNQKTEADGLERIEDDDDLADRIARKALVPLPVSARLTANSELPAKHRYCRPWTAAFLTDLARAHAAQFHSPLEVSSAVRTVESQKRLIETNGNAAAAEGDVVSPHVTGATIDLAKQGLSRQQLGWLRRWLTPLQTAGKIDVEEEFQQSCFHITVYKSYLPPRPLMAARRATELGTRQGKTPQPGKPKSQPPAQTRMATLGR